MSCQGGDGSARRLDSKRKLADRHEHRKLAKESLDRDGIARGHVPRDDLRLPASIPHAGGKRDRRIGPPIRRRVRDERAREARNHRDGVSPVELTSERDHMARALSGCGQRYIVALREEVRIGTSRVQQTRGDEELQSVIIRVARRRRSEAVLDGVELARGLRAQLVVDRPTIVWIDENEVPQLVALIDVGSAGCGEMDGDA
jgi:hypothetical protein